MPIKAGLGGIHENKMPLFNQPNLTSGIDDAIVSTSQTIPAFPIMIMVFIFFGIVLGGSANQKRRIGTADYPFWVLLGSLSISFVALIFSLEQGMINLITLSIVISITIMSAVWFFLSSIKGEI